MRTIAKTLGLTAVALLLLTGCSADPGEKYSAANDAVVEENGDGRIDAGESMAIPSTPADLIAVACTIIDAGEITAVNAQQLNGFGQYMNALAINPDMLAGAKSAATAEEAATLASIYIPLGEQIYAETMTDNIPVPAELDTKLAGVCAGDLTAAE